MLHIPLVSLVRVQLCQSVLYLITKNHILFGWDQLTNLKNTQFLCLAWVAFAVCDGSSSTNTVKCCPLSFAAFGWIWAESIAVYTSELLLLLLSPCLRNNVARLGSRPFSIFSSSHHSATSSFVPCLPGCLLALIKSCEVMWSLTLVVLCDL